MKEDPDEEKEAFSTLINHPEVPFPPECFRLEGGRSYRNGGIKSLEALEAATLRLVALQVCWLGAIGVGAVGEVETIVGHYRLMKQVH